MFVVAMEEAALFEVTANDEVGCDTEVVGRVGVLFTLSLPVRAEG